MYDNIMHYKNLGIDLKGICYPKGYSNEYTPRAARQYFEVGMSSIPVLIVLRSILITSNVI